jgi:ribA/ribD-fused uncharacterized protein
MADILEFQGQYRWLSNFAPCVVQWGGINYPSVEHAYQAAKLADDHANLRKRLEVLPMTAGQAKRWGRSIEIRADWERIKVDVMLNLLRQKFSTAAYKQRLLDTGNCLIQEGNWWGDTFWGVCRGKGENRLGFLIMQVRDELRNKNGTSTPR